MSRKPEPLLSDTSDLPRREAERVRCTEGEECVVPRPVDGRFPFEIAMKMAVDTEVYACIGDHPLERAGGPVVQTRWVMEEED